MHATAHQEFLDRARFGSLDGLRALAVAGTVWHHTARGDGSGESGMVNAGWMGVHLFFAISGFLITTLLLREWTQSGWIDIRAFWRRRVARIFPAFYLTVVGYLVLVPLLRPEFWDRLMTAMPWLLTYTANFGIDPGGEPVPLNHAWTLGVEEQFYLLWPMLMVAALRVGGLRAAAVTAAVTVSVLVVVLPSLSEVAGGALGRGLSTFSVTLAAGALLAVVLRSRRGFRVAHRALGGRYVVLFPVALFVVFVETGASWILVAGALVLLVAACVVNEQHACAGALSWAPVERLGQVSYGVYLYHALVGWCVIAAGLTVHTPLYALATLGATAAVAGASFRWFEQPARLWLGRPSRATAIPADALCSAPLRSGQILRSGTP